MADDRDNDPWKQLMKLAEKEISGESVTKKDVAKALKPICSKLVYS